MHQLDDAIEKFPTSDQLKNQKVFRVGFIEIEKLDDLSPKTSETTIEDCLKGNKYMSVVDALQNFDFNVNNFLLPCVLRFFGHNLDSELLATGLLGRQLHLRKGASVKKSSCENGSKKRHEKSTYDPKTSPRS
jgi:hypothetical protein